MLYPLMTIVGPVILLLALVYVTLRTRKRRPAEKSVTDAGTRRLREELNREDTGGPRDPR